MHRTWRLVLLGPRGTGPDTQIALLSRALGACPLSLHDVFRAAQGLAAKPGSAMARAQASLERGVFVSDETVLDLLRERRRCLHCNGGFMLDGFPRTARQAQAIDALLAAEHLRLDAVISYELPAADQPEADRARLATHAADLAPLIEHYRRLGLLISVNAAGRPEDVFAHTLDALAELVLPAKPRPPPPDPSASRLAAPSSQQ